ncbi:MAG: hypothetical protein FJZ56_03765 [Chlamydiae bacterium]|nr:hypothetical protein [Chlamydiota bacterium]
MLNNDKIRLLSPEEAYQVIRYASDEEVVKISKSMTPQQIEFVLDTLKNGHKVNLLYKGLRLVEEEFKSAEAKNQAK